ncbi:MAG TPA: GNAT family N-acetyltransferase [Solirubrobacteraceae bacterium]|jgi:predicted GNAT family acetyltransferase|nr:GNAT family N-acetyltransferase [Solirubrobacteraceae bacterium]
MSVTVADAPDRSRFEVAVDGEVVGIAEYRRAHGIVAFVHTEVTPGHEGQGLAGKLIAGALDAARGEGLEVLPFCPFVRGYVERHPEYVDLVPADRRRSFGLAP